LHPGTGPEEGVVDINAAFALRVGERIHSGDGASGGTGHPSRDEADTGDEGGFGENRSGYAEADTGDEGGFGENRSGYAHESNDLWKFWQGDNLLLIQGDCSTPRKRIAMPLFNLCRKLQPQNFQKSTMPRLIRVSCLRRFKAI
jgi:hypothetical protein